MLGTFILWFGWYGFNPGSALLSKDVGANEVAALAAVNTTISAGTSGMVALFVNLWVLERYTGEPFFDLKFLMNGALCGLVAITGGCGVTEPWAAAVTGFVAGLLYIVGTKGLLYFRLDDAVDAIPVHLVNGVWGVISVGLFASPTRLKAVYGRDEFVGWFYSLQRGNSNARLLGTQLIGLLFIISWVAFIMLPFFIWLDWKGWFRADPLEEIVGLDTSYHGGLVMRAGHEEINPEYISEYKKKKEEITLRRRSQSRSATAATSNGDSLDAQQSDFGATAVDDEL
jgi:Amt family ammonium transporter